jgi:hypothetical protein
MEPKRITTEYIFKGNLSKELGCEIFNVKYESL